MSPFYYLVERGVAPVAAFQRTYRNIMREMQFRTWYRGQALGDAGVGFVFQIFTMCHITSLHFPNSSHKSKAP